MGEADNPVIDPATRLMAYGIPEWRIKLCVDVLSKSLTVEDTDRELGKQHTTIDSAQLLMPVFRPIYQNEPEIKEAVTGELTSISGITPEIVDEYFLKSGDQPYLVFHLAYEQRIPLETRVHFNEAAGSTVLRTVKTYLGLVTPPDQTPRH